MSPFKTTYGYKLKTLLTLRQAKKTSKITKEKIEKLMQLYRNFYKSVKLVQEYIKKYYN